MDASHNTAAPSAAIPLAADGSISNSILRTPVAGTGTTVLLREEGGTTFMPVHHQSSITLRDLAEEFNISSVLECDAEGNVQPRAVAFDSPSDILHSGRHYIARRDAKAEAGNSYVTFKGKICVKEYELEHPTPPATLPGKSVRIVEAGENEGAPAETKRRNRVVTPFLDKRRHQEALDRHEEYFAAHAAEGSTPRLQRMRDEEEATTISRALALSFERKRPREDSASKTEEHRQASSRADGDGRENAKSCHSGSDRTDDVLSSPSSMPRNGGALLDRTNSFGASPTAVSKTHVAPLVNELHTDETSDLPSSAVPASSSTTTAAPQSQKQSLRFIPFTEIADDGTEAYVTLENLQQLCNDLTMQEAELQKKHRTATDILEGARRVLFLNDGNE
ncbi:hypothetical protein ABB37_02168 [Leptomonas pyrrhocoris]|uniref:Uncharacterized protein n=1 Tax=Leptomonas pyrrhocoris TaxID=157538 RepID=A0A0M9G7C3_LEPPY|nr:hypothetical protein ABB37_02168 [Leptomonas pyrrhocoris]KPA84037.1 hypothetical protein ABB37_02168 [Leptomonas pyrrhocoris]|eukprot:XP_015662476.1 hypothetical protein ABB37_02168 [Leptomonas pyrrhocoris]